MKKHFNAVLLLAAMLLFPALSLSAQEENKNQLWYCWEETVRPDRVDEYLALSREVIEIAKQENYPFRLFTWSRRFGVYEWWLPINTLDNLFKLLLQLPLIYNYTLIWELSYNPE